MEKWLNKLVSFYDRVLLFFTLDEVFWVVFYSYKDIIKNYYMKLFIDSIDALKSKSFWLKLIYNEKYGIFYNILILLFLGPIFRFIILLLNCFLMLIYSVYYLIINFIFDLILKYINVYAKKLHILYDSSLIEEINDLRKIMLLIRFKDNFLENFKARKEINIDGFIYKEEFYLKVSRIFFNVILFFIWSWPLFLSFFSYLVRLGLKLLKNFLRIYWWLFLAKSAKLLRNILIFNKNRFRFYRFRWWKFTKKFIFLLGRFKRKNVIKFNKYNNAILLHIFDRIYDDVSMYFKFRRKFLKYKVKMLKKRYKNAYDKKLKLKLYDKYIYFSYLLKMPININFFVNKIFVINLFNFVSNFLDDKIIKKLIPLNDNVNKVNIISYTEYYYIYFNYLLIKYGSSLHKLNYNAIIGMVHFFIGSKLNYYDLITFKSKSELKFFRKFIIVPYLKLKSRFIYKVSHNMLFPIYLVIRFISFWIFWFLYLIFTLFYYIFLCFFHFVVILLKFLLFLFIIIFFGKEK